MPRKAGPKMPIISFHIPKSELKKIDEFVRQGLFPNRGEFIIYAIHRLIMKIRLYGSAAITEQVDDSVNQQPHNAAAIYAPASLVEKVLKVLREVGASQMKYISLDSLGLAGLGLSEWLAARGILRRLLNALASVGFVKSYGFARGPGGKSMLSVSVDLSKEPKVVVISSEATYKAFIDHAIMRLKRNCDARRVGDGMYMYRFTPRIIEAWASEFVDGKNTLIVIDPSTAYKAITSVLTMMKEQGFVADFGCSDEWLKPYPSINKSTCWFIYRHSLPAPPNVIAKVRELLYEFVNYALASSSYKANIKHGDSPVILTISRFRSYVWERLRDDGEVALYMYGRSSKTTVGNTAGSRHDAIAMVWVHDLESYLAKLRDEGVIHGYRKECGKKPIYTCKYYIYTAPQGKNLKESETTVP